MKTSNHLFFKTGGLLLYLLMLLPFSSLSAQTGPDLALTLSISDAQPGIYNNTIITATLTNSGDQPMSGIAVDLPVTPGQLAFTSSTQTQGSFSSYFEKWTVGDLGPGQSASLEATLFTLTADAIDYFAQVATALETDADSSPGNGICCTPQEDDEAYLSINGTGVLGPDLSLSNLQIPASQEIGLLTTISVTSNNQGNEAITIFTKLGFFLSTDTQYSTDDVELRIFNFPPNLAPGQAYSDDYQFYLPYDLAVGNYYLLAIGDFENTVNESNENNNLIYATIDILDYVVDPCENFYDPIDGIKCKTMDASGNIILQASVGNDYQEFELDQAGNLLNTGTAYPAPESFTVEIEDNKVIKKDESGAVIYEKAIPTNILNNYSPISGIVELVDGTYLLTHASLSIKTDADLNLISALDIPGNVYKVVVATADGGGIISSPSSYPSNALSDFGISCTMYKISADNTIEYTFLLENTFIGEAEALPCNQNQYRFFGVISYGRGGYCKTDKRQYDVELGTSEALVLSLFLDGGSCYGPPGGVDIYQHFTQFQADGSRVKLIKYYHDALPQYNIPEVDSASIFKYDAQDNVLFYKPIDPEQVRSIGDLSILEISNDEVVLIGQKFGKLWFYNPDCTVVSPSGVDLELTMSSTNQNPSIYTSTTFTLQVKNNGTQNASGIIADFPVPTGLAFVNQNVSKGIYSNWNGVWNIGNLNAGESATLDLTLFTLTENAITLYAQVNEQNENDADSSPGNGICCTPQEDDEAALTINGGILVDLALEVSATPTSRDNGPVVYQLTLSNSSTIAATNVAVKLNGVSLSDFSVNTPSAGSVDISTTTWNIPSIAPNTTVTLTTQEYLVDYAFSNPKDAFFEVIAADQNDPDSTPDNDQGDRIANEDDEAAVTISPTGTMAPYDVELVISADRSNANQGQTVVYTLQLENTMYPTSGVIVELTLPNGLTYNTSNTNSGTYDPQTQMWLLDLMEKSYNGSFVKELQIECTVDFADVGPFTLYAQVIESAGQFDVDSEHGNGICCTPVEDDEAAAVVIGNDGNSGSDLELSMTSSVNSFSAWQLFSITLSLSNTGTESATDIVVDFPLPDGTVFQGGNEYMASQGSYNPYNPQQWFVGDLAAGNTAMITFNLFSTQGSNPIIAYAQVLSQNEADSDSEPGNGMCCVANEDDEAVVTLTANGTIPLNKSSNASFSKLRLEHIFPNPSIAQVNLILESPEEGLITLQLYNSQGQLVRQEKRSIQSGINQLTLEVADLVNGLYFIQIPEAFRGKSDWRFIKEGI